MQLTTEDTGDTEGGMPLALLQKSRFEETFASSVVSDAKSAVAAGLPIKFDEGNKADNEG